MVNRLRQSDKLGRVALERIQILIIFDEKKFGKIWQWWLQINMFEPKRHWNIRRKINISQYFINSIYMQIFLHAACSWLFAIQQLVICAYACVVAYATYDQGNMIFKLSVEIE